MTRAMTRAMTRGPKALYHFTCHHGFEGITKTGVIQANVHPFMRGLGALVWLTERPDASAESVGFGGAFSVCDHMAYRYVIKTNAARRWSDVRRSAPRQIVEALEKFGEPECWWVLRRSALASEFELDAAGEDQRLEGASSADRAKR